MMKPIFVELQKQYEGKVKFTVLDADKEIDQVRKYNILGIPTYVFLSEGKEIDRIVGYTPKPAFAARLDQHLAQTA